MTTPITATWMDSPATEDGKDELISTTLIPKHQYFSSDSDPYVDSEQLLLKEEL